MAKNKRWGQSGPQIIAAAGAVEAHALLGGKTLGQVGAEFDLSDEDVNWGYSTNPNNGTQIMSLVLNVKDKKYHIPMSRSLTGKLDLLADPAFLLNCQFRVTHKSLKEEDGVTPKTDDKGRVMLDESSPYMSFGSPSGIVIDKLEKVFSEPVAGEEEETVTLGAETNVGE